MQFANIEDAVKAVLKISCDTSIHGEWRLTVPSLALMICIIGRSLAVIPRAFAPQGYLDLASDDLAPGDPLYAFEQMALNMKV